MQLQIVLAMSRNHSKLVYVKVS